MKVLAASAWVGTAEFLEGGDDVDGGGLAQESGELGFGEADGRGVVGIVRDAEWTQVFWFNWNDCSGM